MVKDILISYLMQIVFLFGPILLFGFLIFLCNRRFYANFGRGRTAVCYLTGFIGTPIHELSHALMCVLFGHRIVEIKLFQVGAEDGTLGYVTHAYNKRNLYQRIGNFFIGIAPIVVISGILFLLAWLLAPSMVEEMTSILQGIAPAEGAKAMLSQMFGAMGVFFSYAVTWQWWAFVGLGMFLALHMTLSGADIKNALGGLFFVLLAFFIVDVVLGLVEMNLLNGFTSWLLGAAGYMICFFIVALVIDLAALTISFLFRAIRRR